ncbi:PTS sugar transporter subunit IIA [candidate division KSB1 bacterium]|nr:PTS sugar transporter subunit IIA [candidate division KSB1 bacterium]
MDKQDLIKYFDEELFLPDLKAKTKDEALLEMVERLAEAKSIKNKDIILGLLHQREQLGSTGIGKGVAIPHGRTTSVSDIMIMFGKSADGIEYEAIDDKPVNLIFMIIAPPQDENNMYLPILGKTVEMLSKSKHRKKLMEVESFQEFVDYLTQG